jgi:hypothetical protein
MPKIQITLNYFQVFDSNCGGLGALPSPLPRHIAMYYTIAKGLVEDMRTLAAGHLDNHRPEDQLVFLKKMQGLGMKMFLLGDDLIHRLEAKFRLAPASSVSAIPPVPTENETNE